MFRQGQLAMLEEERIKADNIISLAYDGASKIANTMFSGYDLDRESIESRFATCIGSYSDKKAKLAIRCAYNFELVKFYFENNKIEKAKELIRDIARTDSVIDTMQYFLRMDFGLDYVKQCLIEKELIVPKKLDEILAKKFITNFDSNKFSTIYDTTNLIILRRFREQSDYPNGVYFVSHVYNEITPFSLLIPIESGFKPVIGLKENNGIKCFLYEGDLNDAKEKLIGENEGVVLFSNSRKLGVNSYFTYRYLVKRGLIVKQKEENH